MKQNSLHPCVEVSGSGIEKSLNQQKGVVHHIMAVSILVKVSYGYRYVVLHLK